MKEELKKIEKMRSRSCTYKEVEEINKPNEKYVERRKATRNGN
jgi:hypothetical protein